MTRAEDSAWQEGMTGPVLGVAFIGWAVSSLCGQGIDALPAFSDASGTLQFVLVTLVALRMGAGMQFLLGLWAGLRQSSRAYGLLQVVLVAQVLFAVMGVVLWAWLSLEGEVVWGLLSGLAGGLLSVGMLARLWSAERRELAA